MINKSARLNDGRGDSKPKKKLKKEKVEKWKMKTNKIKINENVEIFSNT